jgi:hypothetical protein
MLQKSLTLGLAAAHDQGVAGVDGPLPT